MGDGGIGKTSILSVFAVGSFPSEYVPTVFEVSNLFKLSKKLITNFENRTTLQRFDWMVKTFNSLFGILRK